MTRFRLPAIRNFERATTPTLFGPLQHSHAVNNGPTPSTIGAAVIRHAHRLRQDHGRDRYPLLADQPFFVTSILVRRRTRITFHSTQGARRRSNQSHWVSSPRRVVDVRVFLALAPQHASQCWRSAR
jgi:hypothetical protein